ncbi:MAG: LptF/LptG family permease [Bacteroidota bacterium]|nr:LptF/LptG family permease [Bacteroidota bacterium]
MSFALKTIDRYILKKFLGTYVFSNILIITIIIIFDISEKIDNFIYAPMSEVIVDHYLNFIPYFLNMLSPMFTFIAVIFFTSRLAARYETVAILSSGVSYKRFLRPYMIGAAIIALGSLSISHFVIPKANKTRQAFEDKYINNSYQNKETNIHRQVEKGTFIYMESFNNNDKIGFKFTIEKTNNGKLIYMLSADEIVWDSIKQVWKARNYYERYVPETLNAYSKQLKVGDQSDYKETLNFGNEKEIKIDFHPKDMGRVESKVEVMTYPELKKFIAKEKEKGSSGIERFEVENYKRTAIPFSTFILTLIGVCLSSRKIRGGIGMHLALGLLLAASYELFLHVSSIFAINGLMSPIVAVWMPNVIYGAIAYYLYRTAQK